MKKVYWRPRAVSRLALVLIAALSVTGLVGVEYDHRHSSVRQPNYDQKLAAATLASRCMALVKRDRLKRGYEIDPNIDPAESGLVGVAFSPVTSVSGHLPSKRASINPNFAAVIYEFLIEAGVRQGDVVAVGYSGSFPAINICVLAALETLDARPIGISSAASSQWGANLPDFLWLDMEEALFDEGLVSTRSVAASLGGVEDRGVGMTAESREALLAGIERTELPLLRAGTFTASIDSRMAMYKKAAGGERIQAYINVGGGTVSVGRKVGKKELQVGVNTSLPPAIRRQDSVAARFIKDGVPVIHLARILQLAKRFGMPTGQLHELPDEGLGYAFFRTQYNRLLTGGVLIGIVASLYAFIRSDWGFRLFQTTAHR